MYYETCINELNKMNSYKDGHVYLDCISKNTKNLIENSREIVFCGMLSFVEGFVEEVSNKKQCFFFDSYASEGMFLGCPIVSVTDLKYKFQNEKPLFVILSRSGIEFYNYIINSMFENPKIIYYSSLVLTFSDNFNNNCRENYSVDGCRKQIQYIIDNAAALADVLECLADEKSKEIFARIILFRLYYDMRLHVGIKSLYDDYLEDDILPFEDNEIIADLGGYVGDTFFEFDNFFRKHNISFTYHLFEPAKANIEVAKKYINRDNVLFHQACIGSENKEVVIAGDDGLIVSINESASKEGRGERCLMYRLDSVLDNVTYVKMDIEGAESSALIGMSNLVKKCRPKLAVCIYHKYDDIVKLINEVRELTSHSKYKYYVRAQRESVVTEMVFYAIPFSCGEERRG